MIQDNTGATTATESDKLPGSDFMGEQFIKGCDVVKLQDLTLEKLKEFKRSHQAMRLINPGGELFQYTENGVNMGLLIDIQSINLMLKVYESINETNKENFHKFLNDEYKLASLLDKMWSWVKTPN